MKNENSTKVFNIIRNIGIALAIVCAIGNIITLNIGASTPTKLSESVWCFSLILWIGIFLMTNRRADTWEDNYNWLNNEYIKLFEISKEVNKTSIEQNEICREVQANNKELSSGWGKALDENKKLIDERRDLLKALAEFDPQDPVVKALLKKLNGDTDKETPSTNPE